MRNRKTAWLVTALMAAVMALTVLPGTAGADTGPKPSVRITFENLGDEPCYGTLLSSTSSTGPASAWDGSEEDAKHNENSTGRYSWMSYGYDVWKAFVDFDEGDDFYFLQEVWRVDETKELAWTYYPPSEFKILLYFPETGEYAVSGVYERYAFDSYYTVNMEGVRLFAEYNEELSTDERLTAWKSYEYGTEIGSLVARILITIAVEMAVALLFGYREKKQLLLLAGVNGGTQIILNVLLNVVNYRSGRMAFVAYYVLFELVVSVIEAVLYFRVLNRISQRRRPKWLAVVYALTANVASFAAGMLIARWLPGIF